MVSFRTPTICQWANRGPLLYAYTFVYLLGSNINNLTLSGDNLFFDKNVDPAKCDRMVYTSAAGSLLLLEIGTIKFNYFTCGS